MIYNINEYMVLSVCRPHGAGHSVFLKRKEMFTKNKEKDLCDTCPPRREIRGIKVLFPLLALVAAVCFTVKSGYLPRTVFGFNRVCTAFIRPFIHPFFIIPVILICSVIAFAVVRRRESGESSGSERCSEKGSEKNMSVTYAKLFWLFIVGGIAGVIIEGLFCLIAKGHWETHVVSVLVPYNLLYAVGVVLFYIGAVVMKHRPLAVQIAVMTALATALELFCGLLLRYGLGMKAWDYSHSFMNYKGIICLGFSAAWGIAAFVFAELSPRIDAALEHCSGRAWRVAGAVFGVVIAVDLCMTGASILRWSERHYGVSASSEMQRELDREAPDDYMGSRFVEWRFLDEKE